MVSNVISNIFSFNGTLNKTNFLVLVLASFISIYLLLLLIINVNTFDTPFIFEAFLIVPGMVILAAQTRRGRDIGMSALKSTLLYFSTALVMSVVSISMFEISELSDIIIPVFLINIFLIYLFFYAK